MNKTLCIYHGNCADGFGAAWAVRQRFGDADVEFHPGIYGNDPPDVRGRDVVLVDFSYKRPVIDAIGRAASSVLILDHHKTAADDLAGLRAPKTWLDHVEQSALDDMENAEPVRAVFDMNRSGAGIAWDFFHPGQPRPRLLDHIEDRDLWRFLLPHTREIQAAVFSYPYDFTVWDELFAADLELMAKQGEAIERKHHKDIAELVGVTKRRMIIGGISVPVANLPYTLTSDAGSLMAAGEPFAACYWDTPDGRVFSLRSREDGVDVSAIAKRYGGGGHRNASGFRMPIGWEGDAHASTIYGTAALTGII
jgi:oligoribonuclease NrnB/cAMP/cGMP phosphodiesterase (DHH superfamily)